jgi:photosystem II stability/assembly factor-like uncharacterized protein
VGVDNETTEGVILATADGGDTWDAQDPGSRAALRAVAFPDASHGWAVGEAGTILATANGGETWSAQSMERLEGRPQTSTLHDVAFPDASHGWAVGHDGDGRSGVILTTADGGATWTKASGRGGLYAVAFPDAAHGWAAGYGDDARAGNAASIGMIFAAAEAGGTP